MSKVAKLFGSKKKDSSYSCQSMRKVAKYKDLKAAKDLEYNAASLGLGASLKDAVKLPEDEDLNNWLATRKCIHLAHVYLLFTNDSFE